MMREYRHLIAEDRDMIAVYKAQGKSLSQIGKIIGKHKSTILRELRLNTPAKNKGYYLGHKAQQRAKARWVESHQRMRVKNQEVKEYIETGLKTGWSPEIIAGRIKIDKPTLSISHEAIYQYLYSERRDLIGYLVRAYKKRQKRGYSRKHKKAHIPNIIRISERPVVVEQRIRLGDWEADSIVSRKSKCAINILVERMTRLTRLAKISCKTSEETKSAINNALEIYPDKARQTITYDNGSENTEHEAINDALGTKSYFCNPYHSWEKGTVENTVGLVRRHLPKGTDFSKVSNEEINRLEFKINCRPRKCLDYKKPIEVFLDGLKEIYNRLSVALTG